MNPESSFMQILPTTKEGYAIWALNIAFLLLAFLFRLRKRQKKQREQVAKGWVTPNLLVVDARKWPQVNAIVTAIEFTKEKVAATKNQAKQAVAGVDNIVAVVEYELFGQVQAGKVFIGEDSLSSGDSIWVKYDPVDSKILVLDS